MEISLIIFFTIIKLIATKIIFNLHGCEKAGSSSLKSFDVFTILDFAIFYYKYI